MKYLASIVLALSLVSCATYRFVPIPSDGVVVVRDREKSLLQSSGHFLEVSSGIDWYEENVAFRVTVKNLSPENQSLKDTDFRIEESPDGLVWSRIPTLSSDVYYRQKVDRHGDAALLELAGLALDAASKPKDEKEEMQRRENREREQKQREAERKEIETLAANLFFEKVLKPNEVYTGMVLGHRTQDRFFRIGLERPEPFTFTFEYRKNDAKPDQ